MINVDVEQNIAASASEISAILLDHPKLARFFDARFSQLQSANADEMVGGKGAVREVTIAGVKFSEQVLLANTEHIRYAIIGDRPLRNHQGNIYLAQQAASLTKVRYTIVGHGPKWLPDKLLAFLLSHGVKKALVKLNQHVVSNQQSEPCA
ncbi:MAG: SRPBCC family protein [Cognaticolwellia sp.]